MASSHEYAGCTDQAIEAKEGVRSRWRRFAFLHERGADARGWTADVIVCVRKLKKQTFTLTEVYRFEQDLQALHPRNLHVKDKIRQQLQVLRDHGILRFAGRGTYELAVR